MNQTFTLREKTKQIILLLVPVLITQLGMFSMVFFNTILSGNYDSADLAAVAIGASIWNPVFTGLSGILLAVSPIVAQHVGEKKNRDVSAVVIHGIYLSFVIGIIVIALGFFLLTPLLNSMDLTPRVQDTAFHYLAGLSFGIIPLFVFNVLRSFIYGLGNTRVIMFILILALPVNFFFNYVLIFGKWWFPELGGAGGGYATAITYWFIVMMTIYIIVKQSSFSSYIRLSDFRLFSLRKCMEILKIGVPMGLSAFFETSMFAVVTILISRFNIVTVAAYQSALNIVSFMYMVPLSISMAETVLVGYEVGARRYHDARTYSWLSIGLSVFVSIFVGLFIVAFRYDVASLYSHETEVINLTAQFLIYALFFHISDAVQVTAQAALRGYKDVNPAFIMTLIAYWMICLPVGYVFAHQTNLGAVGYWLGLTTGLLAAGLGLALRLNFIQRKKFVSARG